LRRHVEPERCEHREWGIQLGHDQILVLHQGHIDFLRAQEVLEGAVVVVPRELQTAVVQVASAIEGS
ncbi:hypothetical protein PENTCL1PPCAC_1157, partial [Pristionchus entomophagus]